MPEANYILFAHTLGPKQKNAPHIFKYFVLDLFHSDRRHAFRRAFLMFAVGGRRCGVDLWIEMDAPFLEAGAPKRSQGEPRGARKDQKRLQVP